MQCRKLYSWEAAAQALNDFESCADNLSAAGIQTQVSCLAEVF